MIRNVAILCTGNTCRSPMAAVLLKQLWQEADPVWDLVVWSAGVGTVPGLEATEHAQAVIAKRGLDLSAHRSRLVDKASLAGADLILTMTRRHKEQVSALWPETKEKVFVLSEYAGKNGDIEDPFGGSLSIYEETAAALEEQLKAVVERIRREEVSRNESGDRV